MVVTIFYATATGTTEMIADQINQLIPNSKLKNVDDIKNTFEFECADALICCIPTWNTDTLEGRSGTAWDNHITDIATLNLSAKPVAIVGLGDSILLCLIHYRRMSTGIH